MLCVIVVASLAQQRTQGAWALHPAHSTECPIPAPILKSDSAYTCSVELEVENQSGGKVDIIWVETAGIEVKSFSLKKGAKAIQTTCHGHAWRARSSRTRRLLAELKLPRRPAPDPALQQQSAARLRRRRRSTSSGENISSGDSSTNSSAGLDVDAVLARIGMSTESSSQGYRKHWRIIPCTMPLLEEFDQVTKFPFGRGHIQVRLFGQLLVL